LSPDRQRMKRLAAQPTDVVREAIRIIQDDGDEATV
jgi:hypothetical protein